MRVSALLVLLVALCRVTTSLAADLTERGDINRRFDDVRPVMQEFCLTCHATAIKDGNLDLERFSSVTAVRGDLAAWRKVVEMLEAGEMPPNDEPQPSDAERKRLIQWARDLIDAEIRARAGDPGQVVLRRLNNAEYTYTIRDLTGVPLDPAREFPVDGAAGEGFINTGDALAMSPALLQKYLDASKEIAEHAVLLPDGFQFSAGTTRRDWANEFLTQIRLIYARHTSGESDTSILNRWSADPNKSTENDGRVDLARYFTALVRHRERLLASLDGLAEIAEQENLNEKYLRYLAEMLVADEPQSLLLEDLRSRWRDAKVEDGRALAADVRAWQDQLWKFYPVAHLGLIQRWQQPNNPLPESVTLRRAIAPSDTSDVVIYLVATDAGDGAAGDVIVLNRPRIEFKDRPPILLRDVRPVTQRIRQLMTAELGRTDQYLLAVAELRSSSQTIDQIATERKLDSTLLANWAEYIGLGQQTKRALTGHLTKKRTNVEGYEAVSGWSNGDLPVLFTNRSDQPISFSTLTIPAHGLTVHPTPTQEVVLAWQSPLDGNVRMAGKVADADDKCGNGAAWRVELLTGSGTAVLAAGAIDNGRAQSFEPNARYAVRKGDVLLLVVNSRDKNHVCDTTHVDWKISEDSGSSRVWNLASDVVADVLAGNPHPDAYGNPTTWHFLARDNEPAAQTAVPPGSTLARWRTAALDSRPQEELAELASAVRDVLAAETANSLEDPDQSLRKQLTDWSGPLNWAVVAGQAKDVAAMPVARDEIAYGLDPAEFGRPMPGSEPDSASLIVQAPRMLTIRLHAALVRGGEFVVESSLDPQFGGDGSVQVRLLAQEPKENGDRHGALWPVSRPSHSADRRSPELQAIPADFQIAGEPIITRAGSPSRNRVAKAYDDFRTLFPAAMCHARIVPVDAVVTLVLYHREDDQLVRLMLDEQETARLDRLWSQLHFVSQDALRMEVGLEQILEFATQDADPKFFDPVRGPIANNAAAFRQQLLDTESVQLDALVRFAARAYRRPLREQEQQRLIGLYESLRKKEVPHEDAFRLTLARILSSPTFLYRLETPGAGAEPTPVSAEELAIRLSYFLWSSLPDDELSKHAENGSLTESETLAAQSHRLLHDDRVRRLAVEFACQWLHLRDFDQLDEKSERHFPEFAALRGDMYEETIRFFEDLFRNDGSILDILDADHTFLNESLAKHYGIPNVTGDQWRRVDGVKQYSRGGILTQASTLARQSGASRTSPILRGNWVAETLLNERLPRPPKNVPQLPDDEAALDGLTVRQLVERHTSDAACAKCHVRIDPYGFALERFDAIGRLREKDLGGRPIDTRSKLLVGTDIDGDAGLREYLVNTRRDAFVRQFCRKLLGFALGRAVQLSDEPLLDEMMRRLREDDYRFSGAVETIVLSKQFRMIRGAGML